MPRAYTEGETFQKLDFTTSPLPEGTYESCRFIGCNLYQADLFNCTFADCYFVGCNLSSIQIVKASFRDTSFTDCKMMGIQFSSGNELMGGLTFQTCQLDFSSFHQRKLKKTSFKNTSLQQVDFTEADLASAIFDGCNLAGATFEATNLTDADFRTAHGYLLDPTRNRVKHARFSYPAVLGLLASYQLLIE